MHKIILVIGGIRSGKSVFAEQKARYYSGKPFYLATGIAFDEEMKERVKIHKDRRQEYFNTIEEPSDLRPVLNSIKDSTVLVDCLTLNLSNRLLNRPDDYPLEKMIEEDDLYINDIVKIAECNNLKLILVANEVGLAPVSINKLGRKFQDLQGRWNRRFAEAANEVWILRAGIPENIKKTACCKFKLSAPSFVLPTGYLENIVYLQNRVQDVQLLLFESSADDPLFANETLSTLNYLAGEDYLTYSVHMPLAPRICDNPEAVLQNAVLLMNKLQAVKNISGYTFHFDLPKGRRWCDLQAAERSGLEDIYIGFFKDLKEKFPDAVITLENTETPISALDKIIESAGIYYCIDLGHLLKQGYPIEEVKERLELARIVHLHGCKEIDGKLHDHKEVIFNRQIFELLENFDGVLTVENYHTRMLETSLAEIGKWF